MMINTTVRLVCVPVKNSILLNIEMCENCLSVCPDCPEPAANIDWWCLVHVKTVRLVVRFSASKVPSEGS